MTLSPVYYFLKVFIMGNSQNRMPKVDFKKDPSLKTAHVYSRYIEAKNIERAVFESKKVSRSRKILAGSLILVFGIYSYTLFKIKQETFLDDFEEPPRIIKS